MADLLASPCGRFVALSTELSPGDIIQVQIKTHTHQNLSWAAVVQRWQQEYDFRAFFSHTLAQMPYEAFFWETPPLSYTRQGQAFEYVAVNAPTLARLTPEPAAFAEHLDHTDAIKVFPNLGGDALLVVPCQQGPATVYTHLAQFVRRGPSSQIDALWQQLGQTLHQYLMAGHQPPRWVSTSGLGVAWLHVRLDSTPKYYQYHPYRHYPS